MKLNLRSIDLNLLTIFAAIMSEKRMSRAAEQLHMTQPAVSHALARLRVTFDDELFVRTRRGMMPTPRAQALAGPILDALASLQNTLQTTPTFDPASSQHTFRIAFMQYGEISLLPALLAQLAGVGNGITIESVSDDHHNPLDQVRELEIDFCFDIEPPNDERLRGCLCGQEEWVVIASRHHPRLKDRISPREYFSERHVVLSLQGQRRQYVQQTMLALGGMRKILAEVQQYIAVPWLVSDSEGIATVPRSLVDYPPYQQQLQVLALPFTLPPTPYYLIWHAAMEKDPAHRWMKQRLLAVAGAP